LARPHTNHPPDGDGPRCGDCTGIACRYGLAYKGYYVRKVQKDLDGKLHDVNMLKVTGGKIMAKKEDMKNFERQLTGKTQHKTPLSIYAVAAKPNIKLEPASEPGSRISTRERRGGTTEAGTAEPPTKAARR